MNTVSSMVENWWIVLIKGLALLALGFVFAVWPGKSVVTVTIFIGLLLLIDGAISALMGLFSPTNSGHRWPALIQGLVGVIFGLLIFNWPKVTLGFLVFVVALWVLVIGILTIAAAVAMRKDSYGNWLVAGLGIIALIIGLVLFANPAATVVFLSVIYGVVTIVMGIMTVALSLDLRKLKKDLA